MIEQKIVYGCDHIINKLIKNVEHFTIVRGSDGDDDVISKIGSIIEIHYIYIASETGISLYRKDVDYTLLDNSKVHWLTASRPNIGDTYTCEALHYYRQVLNYTSSPSSCERCLGNGWYVAPISSDNRHMEATADSINKLVQDYIKALYTDNGELAIATIPDATADMNTPIATTNNAGFDILSTTTQTIPGAGTGAINTDTTYGTFLSAYIGQSVYSEDVLLSDISTELMKAAKQVQLLQNSAVLVQGAELSNAESLKELQILSLEYSKEDMGVYVSILLISKDDSTAVLNFKF